MQCIASTHPANFFGIYFWVGKPISPDDINGLLISVYKPFECSLIGRILVSWWPIVEVEFAYGLLIDGERFQSTNVDCVKKKFTYGTGLVAKLP